MTASIEVVRRKLAEINARRALRETPAWRPLQQYLERTKSTGCSYIDYWHLYRHTRKHQPREILELGTGASTIVMAHALAENGGGRITSMEESEEWYRHAMDNLPAGLPVELVLSDTIEDAFSIFRGIRYRDIPDRAYDFVFVDGPAYKTKDGDVTFDFDFISVVANSTSAVRGIVDKRVSTCFVLQRVLPGKVRYVPHLGLAFIDPVTSSDLRTIDGNAPSTSFDLGRIVEFKSL
jgi:hypothetical protein